MYDDIAIFLKVVELGTYVSTAQHLNTTQSTISRRIKSLEEQLGSSLFKRNFRGLIEPTEAGELLFQKFHPFYKKFDTLIAKLTSEDKLSGTLKIALPATLSRSIISPFIPEFSAKYPGITLLIDYSSKRIDMMKDNYDIAVSSVLPLSQNSKVKLLHKTQLKLYATNDYLRKFGVPNNLKELVHHQCLGLLDEHGEAITNYTVRHIASDTQQIYHYQAKIYINHVFQGIEMAIHGGFIAGIWDDMAVNLLKNNVILPVLAEYSFGEQPYYLIRGHAINNPFEKLFAKFLEECFAQIAATPGRSADVR